MVATSETVVAAMDAAPVRVQRPLEPHAHNAVKGVGAVYLFVADASHTANV